MYTVIITAYAKAWPFDENVPWRIDAENNDLLTSSLKIGNTLAVDV